LKEIKKDFIQVTFKEIFQFNNFFHKIKLDKSEKDFSVVQGEKNTGKEKVEDEQSQGNEWNQEYELIYLSYVLEK
jgi:hypothetical protein